MNRFIPAAESPTTVDSAAFYFAFQGHNLLHYPRPTDILPRQAEFDQFGLETVRQQFLGWFDSRPCYAVELAPSVKPPDGLAFSNLRPLYAPLGEALFMVAGRAVQIIAWDRNHQFCGRCGTKTVEMSSDRAKRCPECGLSHYPRLAPSMIVAVHRDNQILLARSPHFAPGMYSVLAGFVEPGETIEQTVAREVMEEVGIRVTNIRYFGSQPWPFPNSLMIAFTADYLSGEFRLDRLEIEDAGWYTADKLPKIPPHASIARHLIDEFVNPSSA